MTALWLAIRDNIQAHTGESLGELDLSSVGGGCINEAYLASAPEGQRYFVKLNAASKLGMFESEARALQEMSDTQTIRVPRPICSDVEGRSAYLVIEAISMQGRGDSFLMGQQLAALHQVRSPDGRFGWHEDNVIGETHQPNDWKPDWQAFWLENRLGFQTELAARKGLRLQGLETLIEQSPQLFEGYDPPPSLVHGDLWGGNASYDESGRPVLFDPAVYYGDREVDLAFTHMFGGFTAEFYRGYDAVWSLAEGFERRQRWYNLYHELNHFNLFGGGYGSQAQASVKWLLRELDASV